MRDVYGIYIKFVINLHGRSNSNEIQIVHPANAISPKICVLNLSRIQMAKSPLRLPEIYVSCINIITAAREAERLIIKPTLSDTFEVQKTSAYCEKEGKKIAENGTLYIQKKAFSPEGSLC